MICFLTKYLLLPQRMDGWSPTYRAERVKLIGRLINLTPNQNWRRIARPFRKKLVEEVTRPLSNAVDARGSAEKRAIFITNHLNSLDQAKSPTHCQFSDHRLASASLRKGKLFSSQGHKKSLGLLRRGKKTILEISRLVTGLVTVNGNRFGRALRFHSPSS